MSEKVKVKVSESHFRDTFNLGDTKVGRDEVVEVEKTITVRNAVNKGTLELVEGEIGTRKRFQGDDKSGEEGEEDDGQDLTDITKKELQEMCEDKGLKKTGTKKEIIERLKNE